MLPNCLIRFTNFLEKQIILVLPLRKIFFYRLIRFSIILFLPIVFDLYIIRIFK